MVNIPVLTPKITERHIYSTLLGQRLHILNTVRYYAKKNRLASENLFWLVKSNLSPDTGLLSWKVSLEPWYCIVFMGIALSPWVLSCFYGYCIVSMGVALSPWVLHCLHGYCIVSMGIALSPWFLYCLHGYCIVSMVFVLFLWVLHWNTGITL